MAELEPITRKEQYLAKAAGKDVETPEPITREEMYLDAIAKSGDGGGDTFEIVFTGTYDEETDETIYTCSKTFAEISTEYSEHGVARMRAKFLEDDMALFPVTVYMYTDYVTANLTLALQFVDGGGFSGHELLVDLISYSESGIQVEYLAFVLTPSPDA